MNPGISVMIFTDLYRFAVRAQHGSAWSDENLHGPIEIVMTALRTLFLVGAS